MVLDGKGLQRTRGGRSVLRRKLLQMPVHHDILPATCLLQPWPARDGADGARALRTEELERLRRFYEKFLGARASALYSNELTRPGGWFYPAGGGPPRRACTRRAT